MLVRYASPRQEDHSHMNQTERLTTNQSKRSDVFEVSGVNLIRPSFCSVYCLLDCGKYYCG